MLKAAKAGLCALTASSLVLACPGWAAAGQIVAGHVKAVPYQAGSFHVGASRLGEPIQTSMPGSTSFGAFPSLPAVPLRAIGASGPADAPANLLSDSAPEVMAIGAKQAVVPSGDASPKAVRDDGADAPSGIEFAVSSGLTETAGGLLGEAGAVLSEEAKAGGAAALETAESKGRWDRFWSKTGTLGEAAVLDASPMIFSRGQTLGSLTPGPLAQAAPQDEASAKAAQAKPAEVPPAPARAEPKRVETKQSFAKAAKVPLLLGGLYAAARYALPAWLPGAWVKAAPCVAAGGIFAATFALNRLVRVGVAALGRRALWQPGTVVAVRLIASIVLWVAGGGLALHAAGVSTAALLATFGIGGVAMTMAAKEFIGNFLEGVKILLTRPFVIDDRIKIGTAEYTVKDMGLRYVELSRPDGGTAMMTYSQLSEKPVTVFGEYAARKSPSRARGEQPKPGILAASLWTALGLGLSAALPFMPALIPIPAVAAFIPYAQGALTLLAARSLEKGAAGFIRRLAESRGWSPQGTAVLKLAVQLLVYLVGGGAALRFFGLTWGALLASLGATSIALGWASSDVIGNLIQGFWILMNHPFTIGDSIEIGAVSGTVIDVNLNYVALEHPERSYTLVPYAAVKASAFTVLPKTVR
ncbi:MAG: mechanosensitive ion channel [Elusimicrobia bacterium]|nr:mechanosensitive ion channel [Elusimicrobiota bacterium]